MEEKIRDILEQYHVEVYRVYRGRGSFICETGQGLKLVKAYNYSPNRLEFEIMVKAMIRDRGYYEVDQLLYNIQGNPISKNNDDKNFIMKDWYEGRECDPKSAGEIVEAVKNLSKLHRILRQPTLDSERLVSYYFHDRQGIMVRHCQELKRIANYIQNKKQKTPFENLYMSLYPEFYGQACTAIKALQGETYQNLLKKALEGRSLCHGDYTHHNVLMSKNRVATVNFENLNLNIQVNDLYQFMRKILEKNHWNLILGQKMLEAYQQEGFLDRQTMTYLYTLFLFPEKFWKIANHYYNARKSWISARNFDKLKSFTDLRQERQAFLCFLEEKTEN